MCGGEKEEDDNLAVVQAAFYFIFCSCVLALILSISRDLTCFATNFDGNISSLTRIAAK